jgi:hypothetical protein
VLSMIAPKVGTASLYSRHSSTILSTSSACICIKGQCQEMHDCPKGGNSQLVYSRHSSTILSTSSACICTKGQCQEMHDFFEGL